MAGEIIQLHVRVSDGKWPKLGDYVNWNFMDGDPYGGGQVVKENPAATEKAVDGEGRCTECHVSLQDADHMPHCSRRPKDSSPAVKKMSPARFRELGLLQEINRQFLHPRGLAMEITVDDDGTERFGGVWDYRNDPEGLCYDGDLLPTMARAAHAEELFSSHAPHRQERLGFIVQPLQPHVMPRRDEGHPEDDELEKRHPVLARMAEVMVPRRQDPVTRLELPLKPDALVKSVDEAVKWQSKALTEATSDAFILVLPAHVGKGVRTDLNRSNIAATQDGFQTRVEHAVTDSVTGEAGLWLITAELAEAMGLPLP